jgi:hypothetical protein
MQISPKQAGLLPGNSEDGLASARPLSLEWITDELVEDTRRVWSPVYGRVLSDEEAVEILTNVKRFAEVILNTKGGPA